MLALRVEKSVRVVCSLALLLLLAAQGKVCPWLTRPPAGLPNEPADRKAADEPAADGERDRKSHRQPTKLPFLLPDTAAPRWPAVWADAQSRQAAGWHDGVVSCGQRTPASGDCTTPPAACDPMAWHGFQLALEPAGPSRAFSASSPPLDRSLLTCICRTGPPPG